MRNSIGRKVIAMMAVLGGFCQQTKDAEMIAAYEDWNAAMEVFLDYCTQILAEAEKEDFEIVGVMVDELKTKKDPVQETEDAYGILAAEKQKGIQDLSTAEIRHASRLSMVFADEIRVFADNSRDTANKIQSVSSQVMGAVDSLAQNAENSSDINDTIESMNVSMKDIASVVDESAKGVTSAAANAAGLAVSIRQIQKETENNQEISLKLSSEVNRFKKG